MPSHDATLFGAGLIAGLFLFTMLLVAQSGEDDDGWF